MPRTKQLVSALALALAGMSTAQATDFTAVISFGDSLTDAGNVALVDGNPFTPPGASFTTNPDQVYAQIVAQALGYTGANSLSGGSNYAYGGGCVRANSITFTCSQSPGSFSLTTQLGTYLTANGGSADPNALYTMWGGANDIFTYAALAGGGFITPTQAQQLTGLSALTMVGLVDTLQNAGAETIVVFNLPNLGATPYAAAVSAQTSFAGLTYAYNETLDGGIATLDDGIVAINVFGLFNEIIADPSTYGFTNITGVACGTLSGSLACGPAGDPAYFYHYASGTNSTYLFADGVHPSGAAHAMLANVVLATIQAPGQISIAGELPLQVYDSHSNLINTQIFGMAREQRSEGESNVYASVQGGRLEFNGDSHSGAFDSNTFSATLGADVRWTDMFSVGASVGFGSNRGDGYATATDANEVLFSLYGVMHAKHGYLSAILSGGRSAFDISRSITLGPATRIESGDTSANHVAFEFGGGLNFGSDSLLHGPFASITWQQVTVDDYAEEGLSSTAMWFSEFTRESTVGRLGWQIQGQAGAFRPYGRLAYAMEDRDQAALVQAGSNTLNGHFTLEGYMPADEWIEADLGFGYQMSENAVLDFAWRGRLSDDSRDFNSIRIGARWEFGGEEAAPEPEVVPEPVAPSCVDLDDDGDGVNNCEDKCPATPSGEAIGVDGCPVPAEPEPVMEPKPYRN